jgi:cell division protein FtsQ
VEGRVPGRPPRARVASFPARQRVPAATLARFVPSRRSLAIGIGLLVGAVLAYVIARETPLFALRTVTVEGAPADVADQVRSALEPLSGTSLVTLNGSGAMRRVEALPTVISARYDRAFPHRLVVMVRPEQPVAVLRQGREAWLLSARGRVMRHLEPRTELRLPRIWLDRSTAVALGGLLGGDTRRSAQALAVLAGSPLAGRVATSKMEDGALTLVLRSGLQLLAGRPAALSLKLAIAARVLQSANAGDGRGYLDVSVPERPVGHFYPQPAG